MRLAIGISLVILVVSGCMITPRVEGDTIEVDAPSSVHRAFLMEQSFFDRAYADVSGSREKSAVRGGIVPHHLLASHLIAEFFSRLELSQDPSVVVVIGPNHREIGTDGILISEAAWETPYGRLQPYTEGISSLIQRGVVQADERVFVAEHSISAEVSFIKKSFPEAQVLPIVLMSRATEADLVALASALHEVLPKDALVLASVDFAHYVSSEEADTLDAKSRETLVSFDVEGLASMAVDSPASIYVLMRYLTARNAQKPVILENSDSAKVIGDLTISEVTSYFTMYFLN
ncbi:MAG TPA: AmmeMemoRadiSam system protein B [Candidatus Kerfeldbacteria bacterium]|nr:AmmeMemoRadiSam system protein B [Candidatus Kerfeldbacteria bacterium]